MKTKISIEEALELLLAHTAPVGTETLPLSALAGRVLAEEVRARVPVPPFDRSPYDGYALIAADTAAASRENPVTLRLTEEIPAGKAPTVALRHGLAAKILTGAPLPPGADVTVKYETVDFTDGTVTFREPVHPGDVVRAGEDVEAGALLAEPGTELSPAHVGMLAGQGVAAASVYRRPAAAVLSTGSELAKPGEPLGPAQIYNSNAYTIAAYLNDLGCGAENLGAVPDDPEAIAAAIRSALGRADLVITTGGASVGDYDWAVRVFERIGAEILFWKVSFKPGGSLAAAVAGDKLILSLSGNPGAAVIGLLRLGLPVLRRLRGCAAPLAEPVRVLLKGRFKKDSPQRRLVRGRLLLEDGRAWFLPSDGQGNGVVSSLLGCDLLAELPAGTPPLEEGALLTAWPVPAK